MTEEKDERKNQTKVKKKKGRCKNFDRSIDKILKKSKDTWRRDVSTVKR